MNLKLKSSTQLIVLLNKVKDDNFTDDHKEMAGILNSRKKLTRKYIALLDDAANFWEDVKGEPKAQKSKTAAPKKAKAKKEPKAKKASTRVKYEHPRPLEVGDIVEFAASPNSKEAGTTLKGEITGFQPGAREDQVYARVKGDFGTKVKRDYACNLLVEESTTNKERIAKEAAEKEAAEKSKAEKKVKAAATAKEKPAAKSKEKAKPKAKANAKAEPEATPA